MPLRVIDVVLTKDVEDRVLRQLIWTARFVAFAVGLSGGAASIAAQTAATVTADDWLRARIGSAGREQKTAEIRQMLRVPFFQSDYDGGGISPKDAQLGEAIDRAQQRAGRLSQALQRDLDSDGVVTREEIETVVRRQANQPINASGAMLEPTPEQVKSILSRLVADALQADSDKDGRLTREEMSAEPAAPGRAWVWYGAQQMVPMSFDANADGTVSLAEYDAAVDRIIAEVDADKDGVVSISEGAAAQQRAEAARRTLQRVQEDARRAAELAAKAKSCGFPAPDAKDKIILLGAYEGKTMSNVSIGGDDLEVGVIHVDIEKGDEPLYILATSFEANIWHVTGDSKRVTRFVATSSQGRDGDAPRVAVSGLSKDRVSFLASRDCMRYFDTAKTGEGLRAKGDVATILGRVADDVIGSYGMGKVTLPSGIQDPDAKFPQTRLLPRSGPAADMWRESLRNAPGGVADLNPQGIVAPLPVKAYEVLPQQAGLAQLIEDGALEIVNQRRVRKVGGVTIVGEATIKGASPSEEYSVPGQLKIVKKMRFPAGLNGGHSTSFILGKGVAMPEGSPGHSTVISEETGEIIMGR